MSTWRNEYLAPSKLLLLAEIVHIECEWFLDLLVGVLRKHAYLTYLGTFVPKPCMY